MGTIKLMPIGIDDYSYNFPGNPRKSRKSNRKAKEDICRT